MPNNIGIVYFVKDAEVIAKSKTNLNNIICLSPDSYEVLKEKYKNILTPLDFNNKFKLTKKLIEYELKIKKILEKEKYLKNDPVKETFLFLFFSIISSIEWINMIVSCVQADSWIVVDQNKIINVKLKEEALKIVYKNIFVSKIGKFGIKRSKKQNFKFIINIINKLIFKFANKNQIWFTGNNYGFPDISKNIFNDHNNCSIFYFFSDQKNKLARSIISLIKTILNKKEIIGMFPIAYSEYTYKKEIDEILKYTIDDNIKIVKELLSKYLTELCDYTNNVSPYINKIITNTKPKLLIAHNLYFLEPAIIGYLFKKNNLPIFILSHGSHRYTFNEYSHYELERHANGLLYSKFASHIFIQNLAANKLIDNVKKRSVFSFKEQKLIKTHPIMWGSTINHKPLKDKNDFVFLHASTFKVLSGRDLIYENSFEYLENIILLSQSISKIKNSKLIILAKNLEECSISTLKKNLINYKNVIVKSSGTGDRSSFADYLTQSDCLISYSSTTIEEAIYNKIPVGIINFSKKNYINFNFKKINNNEKIKAIYELNSENLSYILKLIIKNHRNNKLDRKYIDNYFDTSNKINSKYFSKNLFDF